MKDFLFERYRYGVREQTLDMIINQLKDRSKIYGKPTRRGSNVVYWYATEGQQP